MARDKVAIIEAEEEKVKSKEFTYLAFLWKEYSEIRLAERDGNYPRALSLAISLIPYLPRVMKKQLGKKAEQIEKDIKAILATQRNTGFHTSHIEKNLAVKNYARENLPAFIDELSTLLDKRQYMEQTRTFPVGGE